MRITLHANVLSYEEFLFCGNCRVSELQTVRHGILRRKKKVTLDSVPTLDPLGVKGTARTFFTMAGLEVWNPVELRVRNSTDKMLFSRNNHYFANNVVLERMQTPMFERQ